MATTRGTLFARHRREGPAKGATFAERLNLLFDTVHPPGRGLYLSAEVIAALREQGMTISAPYLSQLRTGQRTRPAAPARAALADFFGIQAAYFTDDEHYDRIRHELALLTLLRDEDVRRLARDVAALTPTDRRKVRVLIDQLQPSSP